MLKAAVTPRSRPADPGEDIAASIAISCTAKASARYTAALSHHKATAPAPTSGMRVTLAAKSVFGQGTLLAGAPLANNALVPGRNWVRRLMTPHAPRDLTSAPERVR